MRLLPVVLLAPLWMFQAAAQPAPPQTARPQPQATATAEPAAEPHKRMSWQQRFAQANLSHDGHLTLEQAKGGYATVARHFAEIDAGKKGYVTEDDIAAWHKRQRDARRAAPTSTEDALRPRPALHRSAVDPQSMKSSTDGAAAAPADQGGAPAVAPDKVGTDPASPAPGA